MEFKKLEKTSIKQIRRTTIDTPPGEDPDKENPRPKPLPGTKATNLPVFCHLLALQPVLLYSSTPSHMIRFYVAALQESSQSLRDRLAKTPTTARAIARRT